MPDVVHINTVFPHSFFLAKKAKRHGIPVVYHAHSTKEDFRNSYVGSKLVCTAVSAFPTAIAFQNTRKIRRQDSGFGNNTDTRRRTGDSFCGNADLQKRDSGLVQLAKACRSISLSGLAVPICVSLAEKCVRRFWHPPKKFAVCRIRAERAAAGRLQRL